MVETDDVKRVGQILADTVTFIYELDFGNIKHLGDIVLFYMSENPNINYILTILRDVTRFPNKFFLFITFTIHLWYRRLQLLLWWLFRPKQIENFNDNGRLFMTSFANLTTLICNHYVFGTIFH